jgi:hypothetical protein
MEFLNDVKCSESWQVKILNFRMKIAARFDPLLSEDILFADSKGRGLPEADTINTILCINIFEEELSVEVRSRIILPDI